MTQTTIPDTPTQPEIAQRVLDAIAARPKAMTVTIARTLELPEFEVIRHLPDNRSVELDAARGTEIIESFQALGSVHVITNNGVVTLEAFGQFGNFSTTGPYFNVQTKDLDMHIRYEELAAAFAVEKPSHTDGVSTLSFQFFKPDGHSAFKVFLTFGGKPASEERVALFHEIRERFNLA